MSCTFRYPTLSNATKAYTKSRFYARGQSRIRKQEYVIHIDRYSYEPASWGDPSYDLDLAKWEAYIQQFGVPRWGCCLISLAEDEEYSTWKNIPNGGVSPDGITIYDAPEILTVASLKDAFKTSYVPTTLRPKPRRLRIVYRYGLRGVVSAVVNSFKAEVEDDDCLVLISVMPPITHGLALNWLFYMPDNVYRPLLSTF